MPEFDMITAGCVPTSTSTRSYPPPRKAFDVLNGLRGLAALVVVLRHQPATSRWPIPAGYLAVDLFFLLSGFVLAYTNDASLRNGTQRSTIFFVRRLIRIYPLYILGTCLGAIAVLLGFRSGATDTPAMLPTIGFFSLLLLPTPIGFAGPSTPAYPLNGPAWSLAFELAANWVYGVLAKWITIPRLLLAMNLSLLGMILIGLHRGSLDEGATLRSFMFSFPRVIFSFSTGIFLFRLRSPEKFWIRIPPFILLVLTALCFLMPSPFAARWISDVVIIAIAFPFIVWLALMREPEGLERHIYVAIGFLSYPLYALQAGLIGIVTSLYGTNSHTGLPLGLAVLTLALLVAGSLLAARFFDEPVRRWLQKKLLSKRASKQAVLF